MAIDSVPPNGPTTRTPGRGCVAPLAALAAALALGALGSNLTHPARVRPPAPAGIEPRAASAEPPASDPAPAAEAAGAPALEPWRDALGGPLSRWAWTTVGPLAPEPDPLPDAPGAEPPRTVMTVPLPVPRPPELRNPGGSGLGRRADRQPLARRPQTAPQPQPQVDDRSFLEKLFGVERSPALAYAALETKPADLAPRRRISPPLGSLFGTGPTAGTAVYNIAARSVTLPSGERLEAHSGLGEGLDDPRLVNVRMRGPTPPGTYDLTEREQPFHGVRAIRLTPVGGSEAVYGRVGLLAHTYMLGPRGDSNGCVSFRDYERFLQAYLRGEIQRLVVVTGTQDALPSLADGSAGTRLARNGS